uniref:Uncharacterized protein n=2 Tax=Nothobranchius TaxID=28779 RepID=A0A1A7Z8Q6_NOTFU
MCWLKTLATALSYFREHFPLSVSKTTSTESSGYLQPLTEETGRRGAPAASILVVLMWVRSQSQLLFTAPPGSLLVMSHYFTTATQIGRKDPFRLRLQVVYQTWRRCWLKLSTANPADCLVLSFKTNRRHKTSPGLVQQGSSRTGPDRVTRSR